MSKKIIALAVSSVLLLSACGGGGDSSDTTGQTTPQKPDVDNSQNQQPNPDQNPTRN